MKIVLHLRAVYCAKALAPKESLLSLRSHLSFTPSWNCSSTRARGLPKLEPFGRRATFVHPRFGRPSGRSVLLEARFGGPGLRWSTRAFVNTLQLKNIIEIE